jgi:hypothetical protein
MFYVLMGFNYDMYEGCTDQRDAAIKTAQRSNNFQWSGSLSIPPVVAPFATSWKDWNQHKGIPRFV